MNSKQSLLFLLIEPVSKLLGDQGGIAASPFIDDEVHLDLVLYRLAYDFCRVLDHFRVQHARDHFIEWKRFGIGLLIAHPEGGDEANDQLVSGVEKLPSNLRQLLL